MINSSNKISNIDLGPCPQQPTSKNAGNTAKTFSRKARSACTTTSSRRAWRGRVATFCTFYMTVNCVVRVVSRVALTGSGLAIVFQLVGKTMPTTATTRPVLVVEWKKETAIKNTTTTKWQQQPQIVTEDAVPTCPNHPAPCCWKPREPTPWIPPRIMVSLKSTSSCRHHPHPPPFSKTSSPPISICAPSPTP